MKRKNNEPIEELVNQIHGKNSLMGYHSGAPNVGCFLCGYQYYMSFPDFLDEALYLRACDPGIYSYPTTALDMSVKCRSCGNRNAFRRYFCFTCNKYILSMELVSKHSGSCSKCGKIPLEFLYDEKRLKSLYRKA